MVVLQWTDDLPGVYFTCICRSMDDFKFCEKLHQESSGKNSGDSNRGPDLCVLQADNNTVYVQ